MRVVGDTWGDVHDNLINRESEEELRGALDEEWGRDLLC